MAFLPSYYQRNAAMSYVHLICTRHTAYLTGVDSAGASIFIHTYAGRMRYIAANTSLHYLIFMALWEVCLAALYPDPAC